jgi:hypothetical protein
MMMNPMMNSINAPLNAPPNSSSSPMSLEQVEAQMRGKNLMGDRKAMPFAAMNAAAQNSIFRESRPGPMMAPYRGIAPPSQYHHQMPAPQMNAHFHNQYRPSIRPTPITIDGISVTPLELGDQEKDSIFTKVR